MGGGAWLDIEKETRDRLEDAGFRCRQDIEDVSPVHLAREAGISRDAALSAIDAVSGERDECPSALDILLARRARPSRVLTFCRSLDSLFGGGVPIGSVTELCGLPGVGKTQLAMQICTDAMVPSAFSGVEGDAMYIDTEGSFAPERFAQIAASLRRHLRASAAAAATAGTAKDVGGDGGDGGDGGVGGDGGGRGDKAAARAKAAASLTEENMLRRLHYVRVHSVEEQIAVVNALPAMLRERPAVRVVVLDSVSFHFRYDFGGANTSARSRVLGTMAQRLAESARTGNVAVVLINQVTTKVDEARSTSRLIPALGEIWGHACQQRLLLYWRGSTRFAHLFKSPTHPPRSAPYAVTKEGIRDVQDSGAARPPKKRARGES